MPRPSAPAQFEQNAEGYFVCPECGNAYARERATRRHMTTKHGWDPAKMTTDKKAQIARRTEPQEPPDEDTVSFQVRSELRELALPLQEKLATIEKRLVSLNREAQDLRDARNQIERTLKGLMGPQQVTRGVTLSETMHRKKFLAVQDYL